MTFNQLKVGDEFTRDGNTFRKCSARHACMVRTPSIDKGYIGIPIPWPLCMEVETKQADPVGITATLAHFTQRFGGQ